MSVTPDGPRRPNWPAPLFHTGQGKNPDPLKINSWFNTVDPYISSFGIQDTDPEALQYYGAETRAKALTQLPQ